MPFYHDVKKYTSPSALALWTRSKDQFIRYYFAGEEQPTTTAMEFGTATAALIETGTIPVKVQYAQREIPLRVEFGGRWRIYARPDGMSDDYTEFVDHKTSRNPERWHNTLPHDVKFAATALAVWIAGGRKRKGVKATLEVIPVREDEWEVVDDVDTHYIETAIYTPAILRKWETRLAQLCQEINSAYTQWSAGETEVASDAAKNVSELAEELERVIASRTELERLEKELKQELVAQMEQHNMRSIVATRGTIYITQRHEWEIPDDAIVRMGRKKFTFAEIKNITAAARAAEKEWKKLNPPTKTIKTIIYRQNKNAS